MTGPEATRLLQRQHIVVAVSLVLLFGLILYRGYGNHLGLRPIEAVSPQHAPIDLNRADRVELLQLPGVGPSLADAILAHRESQGGFRTVEDIQQVRGVGPKTLEKLKPWLKAEALPPREAGVFLAEPQVEILERKPPPAETRPSPAARPRLTSTGKLQPGETVPINEASSAELQQIPGIGPVLASRIIAEREKQPFSSVNDVLRVNGIGQKTLDKIAPYLSVP